MTSLLPCSRIAARFGLRPSVPRSVAVRQLSTFRALANQPSTNVTFKSLCLHPSVEKNIKHATATDGQFIGQEQCHGTSEVSIGQSATMGPILEGHDVLALARTGTGKTLGFMVPVIQSLVTSPPRRTSTVSVLVISPTRELASQIAKASSELTQGTGLTCTTVYGATNVNTDVRRLQNGTDILVGTPGRLNDLITNYGLGEKLRGVKHVIFDEADTLLEGGFLRDIQKILGALPDRRTAPRQTLCFSATMPPDVSKIVNVALLPGHKYISTVDPNEESTHARVEQNYLVVSSRDSYAASLALLEQEVARLPDSYKIMCFFPTARGTQIYADVYSRLNQGPSWQVQSRMSQSARTKAVEAFKQAKKGILFTSDVTARGIDVPNVSFVLQVGAPSDDKQYVHRLGRTARAGRDGHGAIVLTNDDQKFLDLRKMLELPLQESPISPDFSSQRKRLDAAMDQVDDDVKSKAYSAYLGYMKNQIKNIPRTVQAGTEYAMETLRYRGAGGKTPPLEAKTVGMMGLKGVPGLNVVKGGSR